MSIGSWLAGGGGVIVVSGLCFFCGIVLVIVALRHQVSSRRVSAWRPFWRQRESFTTGKAFTQFVWGTMLFIAGAGISLIRVAFR